jgi:hypothetical protein
VCKKSIAFFVVFVTVSGLAWGEARFIALSAGGSGGVVLSREERFPMKAQADGGLGIGVELPLQGRAALLLGLGVHLTLPSSLSGGFAYRGFWGLDMRLLLALKNLLSFSLAGLPSELGLAAGPAARYDRYDYTRLYFFYLGLAAEPLVEIPFPRRPHQALELSMPFTLFVRRDLELSAAGGLSVSWKFYPGRRSAVR